MSWRSELKLMDLPSGEALEITCPNAVLPAMRRRQNYQRTKCLAHGETVSLATAYLDLALPHPRQAPRPTAATAAQSHFDLIEIRGGEAHCLTVECARHFVR